MKYRFSDFGKKLTRESGIFELMRDLDDALNYDNNPYLFLGGGNPPVIEKAMKVYGEIWRGISDSEKKLSSLLGYYDSSGGNGNTLKNLAIYFSEKFSYKFLPSNIAITNGSQNSFFLIFNILCGKSSDSFKKILLPMLPEYIGYNDTGIFDDMFIGQPARIEMTDDIEYEYKIDFDQLKLNEDTGLLAISRPQNPTTQVITENEIEKLARLADENDIPLLIDNAYGFPFPGEIWDKPEYKYQKNMILTFSLSKMGLPALRTGIVIGHEKLISTLKSANAVTSLSPGSLGPAMLNGLLETCRLDSLCLNVLKPFYFEKKEFAMSQIRENFTEGMVRVHRSKGGFFLWLWFPNLRITSYELYQNLKKRNVLVVPGNLFSPGSNLVEDIAKKNQNHLDQCIRVNIAMEKHTVSKGLNIINDEVRKVC